MVASSAPEPVFRDLGPVQVMARELRVPLSPPAVSSYRLPSTGAGTCQIPDKIVLFGLSRQSLGQSPQLVGAGILHSPSPRTQSP